MELFQEIKKYGEKVAFITETGEKITYEQLTADAKAFGDAFQERCLIFIMASNTYGSVMGYVGALRKKVVPILIDAKLDPTLYKKLEETYHPQYLFKPEAMLKADEEVVFQKRGYVLTATKWKIDYQLNPTLALLLTTSGSTGSPKLVRQSAENILSNAQSIATYLEITSEDRPIMTLPMYYTYGLSIINSHLIKGASIILTERTMMEKEFWQLLKEYEATTFGGVPYIYEMLKKLRFERMELPSLRVLTQAGGKLAKPLVEYFAKACAHKNIKFVVMYGQTEATARMSYLPPQYALEKAGSMGIAIPGGSFELLDVENHIIEEPETTGELIYKGDNVTLGYAQNRFDLAKDDENHKVLHTGDMAKRDQDGFYYIVGRKKRFLKLFGSRVNLDEIEEILKGQGFECACTGVDDHLVVYTVGENEEMIRQFMMHHTGIVPGGFKVQHISQIPRNEAGKILYSKLQEETPCH